VCDNSVLTASEKGSLRGPDRQKCLSYQAGKSGAYGTPEGVPFQKGVFTPIPAAPVTLLE
jgi:hypothetical protein